MKKLLLFLIVAVLLVPFRVEAQEPDKLILKGGYEAVRIGFDRDGRPLYQVNLAAPKYLDDLVTPVSTEWSLGAQGYVNGADRFNSVVSDEFVSVSDKNLKSLTWQPRVTISQSGNSNGYKDGEQKAKDKKPKVLAVDPLNPNYKNNTLEWDYGNGVYRRLRLIEGMQQEYYVITKPLNGGFKIEHNIVSDNLRKREPAAWGNDKKGVELIITSGTIEVSKDKLKDAKFPVIIDPDVTFTTSASDGYMESLAAGYAAARTAASETPRAGYGFLFVSNSLSSSYQVTRSYVYFDTSALSGYVLTAAVLRLWVNAIYSTNSESVQIQSGMPTYPHDPLVGGDFDLTNYAGDGGSKAISTFTASAYNSITVSNPAGLAMINTSGWTKFALRTTGDINNTTPTGPNQLGFASYEGGDGFRPELVVTFTPSVPGIISAAASDVTIAGGRLNAIITDDGSGDMRVEDVDVRFGYGVTATLANGTGTAAGAPVSLTPNGVDNNINVTGLGTFTITIPAGHTGTATTDVCTVVGSPFALVAGANVINTGGVIGNIKVTVTLSAFASYTTVTAWDTNSGSYYHTDDNVYYDASGLALNTQYYFAAQARNDAGTTTTSIERTFTTLLSVSDMTIFYGTPGTTTLTLTWIKATGAANTLIRYRTDAYPANTADGLVVYNSSDTSVTHTGLSEGTTYYYSAWGETGGTYSANAVNLVLTTSGGISQEALPSIADPSGGWFVNPDETFLANLQPWYSVINGLGDSWGMPRDNMWLAMILAVILVAGVGSYIAFHAPALSFMIMVLGIMGGVALHILSPYILVFAGFLALGAWATRPQGGP